MRAWTQVKVTNPNHLRHEQAGVTQTATPDTATEVEVKFDLDGAVQTVDVADLQVLGG